MAVGMRTALVHAGFTLTACGSGILRLVHFEVIQFTRRNAAHLDDDVGTARSLSSGRASRGPVGAFAHPTLALSPKATAAVAEVPQ
jgi:hypothetical protein